MRRHPPQRSARLLRGDGAADNNQQFDVKQLPASRITSNSAAAKLKTPPSCSSSLASASSSSSTLAAKRKVEELFRRLQPHSLVQSTEKLLATLRIAPTLFINGEELLPKAPPAPTVAAAASAGARRPVSTTAAWRFSPDAGRFHYGLELQYSSADTELTLMSLTDVRVLITSTTMQTPRSIPLASSSALSSKTWRLVAETDRRVGLALFEISLGDWNASSLLALVWTEKREVARLFLQLHTTELLYSAPQRALRVRRDDDLDSTHGLHSYTAAISLRSLDELFWEREIYQVEFPAPVAGAQNVTVQLLDNVHGGTVAARERVLTSESEPALQLETEAVKYAMTNCFLVDFTLWDAECVPIWGFTRALELKNGSSQQQQNDEAGGFDMSVSSLGGEAKRFRLHFQDAIRGNELAVHLTKLSPPSTSQESTKKVKVWVSQVDVALSLKFINSTFGTNY
ncbi:F-box only protein 15 [Phytophthora cinnamomi]|uniref:F-box only protein 15 n=1 Tax=Phytophthora cinnamomi TaxID=4785 RepID=UPI00355A88BC|nr:F-box only protein 15 [Phytophthora cinnamomi]